MVLDIASLPRPAPQPNPVSSAQPSAAHGCPRQHGPVCATLAASARRRHCHAAAVAARIPGGRKLLEGLRYRSRVCHLGLLVAGAHPAAATCRADAEQVRGGVTVWPTARRLALPWLPSRLCGMPGPTLLRRTVPGSGAFLARRAVHPLTCSPAPTACRFRRRECRPAVPRAERPVANVILPHLLDNALFDVEQEASACAQQVSGLCEHSTRRTRAAHSCHTQAVRGPSWSRLDALAYLGGGMRSSTYL